MEIQKKNKFIIANVKPDRKVEFFKVRLFARMLLDILGQQVMQHNGKPDVLRTLGKLNFDILRHLKGFLIDRKDFFGVHDYSRVIDDGSVGHTEFGTLFELIHPDP